MYEECVLSCPGPGEDTLARQSLNIASLEREDWRWDREDIGTRHCLAGMRDVVLCCADHRRGVTDKKSGVVSPVLLSPALLHAAFQLPLQLCFRHLFPARCHTSPSQNSKCLYQCNVGPLDFCLCLGTYRGEIMRIAGKTNKRNWFSFTDFVPDPHLYCRFYTDWKSFLWKINAK